VVRLRRDDRDRQRGRLRADRHVWVNQHGRHYIGAPFGGYKESGIRGKEDLQELLDHTRVKNVNIDFSGDSPTLAGGNE